MSITQKIALVTGASGGIGKAVAESLAEEGFYVFAAARRLDRLELLRSDNIEPLQIDVTDICTIKAAISHIQSSKGRIDALVNNAGYGLYGTIEGLHLDQVRQQFDVNVFGLGQMMQTVLPLMREQQAGCIVNISSIVGKVSVPCTGWYSASKHAVEAVSDALRVEVKPFGIHVVVIEPGPIKTEFDDIALNMLDQSNDPLAYALLKRRFRKFIESTYSKAPAPDIIARAVVKVVTSKNPRARYAIPLTSRLLIWARQILGDQILDQMIERQLRA